MGDLAEGSDEASTAGPRQAFLLRTSLATRKTDVICEVPVSQQHDMGLMFQLNRNFLVDIDGQSLSILVGHKIDILFQ